MKNIAQVKSEIEPCGQPLETSFRVDLVTRIPVVLLVTEVQMPLRPHLHMVTRLLHRLLEEIQKLLNLAKCLLLLVLVFANRTSTVHLQEPAQGRQGRGHKVCVP